MGLALDYASDASDDAEEQPLPPPPNPAPVSSLGLPPPKNKKRPLKIGFEHPLLSAPTFGSHDDDEDDRASKRVRRVKADEDVEVADKTGKGKSALLDMLPPPKRAVPPSTTTQPPDEEPEESPLVPRKLAKQTGGKQDPPALDLFGLGKLRLPSCPVRRLPRPRSNTRPTHDPTNRFLLLPDTHFRARRGRIPPAPTDGTGPVPGVLPTSQWDMARPHPGSIRRVPRLLRPTSLRLPGRTRVGPRRGRGRAY